jgi:hypothetical protein
MHKHMHMHARACTHTHSRACAIVHAHHTGSSPGQFPAKLDGRSPRRRRQLAAVEDLSARYRRVVEQNRALYNEVQDLKGSIRVFCRIRWGRGSYDASGVARGPAAAEA